MAIGTSEVNAVLTAWAENFVEDVPAVHRNGEYLINYDTLVDHLTNLEYGEVVDTMLKTHEVLTA